VSRSFRERPVTFAAGDISLAGILNEAGEPGRPLTGLAIVIVPGGLTRRVGPHRLYVEIARALAGEGACVLRFDLPGVGESDGEVRRLTSRGSASVQACHVPEVRAALAWLDGEARPAGLALLGHCTGARTAVAAAADDLRVRGVAAWAMPLGTDTDRAPDPALEGAIRRLRARALPVLWAFGTGDPAWTGFRGYCEEHTEDLDDRWAVQTIASANHDFTSVAWTRALVEGTLAWMVGSRGRMLAAGEAT
jgi:dienelactone hydrolase